MIVLCFRSKQIIDNNQLMIYENSKRSVLLL